jgi:hypothetical protein
MEFRPIEPRCIKGGCINTHADFAGGSLDQGNRNRVPESKRPDVSKTHRASLGRGYRLVLYMKCRSGEIGGKVFLRRGPLFLKVTGKCL